MELSSETSVFGEEENWYGCEDNWNALFRQNYKYHNLIICIREKSLGFTINQTLRMMNIMYGKQFDECLQKKIVWMGNRLGEVSNRID